METLCGEIGSSYLFAYMSKIMCQSIGSIKIVKTVGLLIWLVVENIELTSFNLIVQLLCGRSFTSLVHQCSTASQCL